MRPPETDLSEKDSAANKNLSVLTNRASKTTTRAKRLRLNWPSGELLGATRAHFSFLFLEAASFSGAQGRVISGKSVFGGRIIFGRKRPYYFGHPLYAGLSKKKQALFCRKNSRDFVFFLAKRRTDSFEKRRLSPRAGNKSQRFRFFRQKGVQTHLKKTTIFKSRKNTQRFWFFPPKRRIDSFKKKTIMSECRKKTQRFGGSAGA